MQFTVISSQFTVIVMVIVMVNVMVKVDKRFNDGDVLALTGYGGYAVEAGVASDIDIGDAYVGEELTALLILYEEVGEALEDMGVGPAVPTEEDLVGTEDAADAIYGDATMA